MLVDLKYFYRPINGITCHNLFNSYFELHKVELTTQIFLNQFIFLVIKLIHKK